jgi:HAMP domain-containing protein
MRIGLKITLLFSVIGLLSVSIMGWISYQEGKNAIEKASFERLTSVKELKSKQIENYFGFIENQVVSFSKNHTVINSMSEFTKAYNDIKTQDSTFFDSLPYYKTKLEQYYNNDFLPILNKNIYEEKPYEFHDFESISDIGLYLQMKYIVENPNDIEGKHHLSYKESPTEYTKVHQKYHHLFDDYLVRFGYHDIFLVDAKTGNIVYSVYKELDYATSLKDGAFKNSNLAKVFNEVLDKNDENAFAIVDFKPYTAAFNAPEAFIASPIFENEECVGVLIFEMPIDEINKIMTDDQHWSEVGLGETGESYLVADDHTLRNEPRFFIENSEKYFENLKKTDISEKILHQIDSHNTCIGIQEVETECTIAAFKGESSTKINIDYLGVPVLSSYKPLKINGLNWVIVSKIDRKEAFVAVDRLQNEIIIMLIATMVLIIVISYFTSRMLTKPIKSLTISAIELTKGNLKMPIEVNQTDEIGVLANSFRSMQNALSKLINDLEESNQTLEEKVHARTHELQKQKHLLEEKNKEIMDSINYAERIQRSFLATKGLLDHHLELTTNDNQLVDIPKESDSSYFVFFKPKDVVSGDFYWASQLNNGNFAFCCADSTGHGVPGAIMSILNISSLEKAIEKETEPHLILSTNRWMMCVLSVFAYSERQKIPSASGVMCIIGVRI